MSCPEENHLLGYALGNLSADATATLEDHVDACPACCELLANFARGTLTEPGAGAAPANGDCVWPPGGALGRYIILYPLGAGGMGVVYAAFDPELDRKIAIKVIRPELRADVATAQLRLAREARAAARLSHPNVVVVYDVGLVGSELFIAMELVAGGSLSEWLAAERRSLRDVVATFAQAGRGLAAAHGAGIVHRDFKPQNVLVAGDGQVRVTDFGLARAAPTVEDPHAPSDALITTSGAIAGTPAYMSPEQHRGDVPGPASDQFSFCVALHEAVYGVRPFAGATAAELAQAIESNRRVAPPPTAHVPAWLRRLLLRGLNRDPRARFPSMTALVDALERGLSARRRRAVAAGLAIATLAVTGAVVRTFATAGAAVPICASALPRLDGVWDGAVKARTATAFGNSSRRYAAPALAATTESLDRYAASWIVAHRDACEAANVRHEQSADVLDLRMICLDHRLADLRALADLLSHADDHVIEKAVAAVADLPALSECADVERLRLPVRPPADPIKRAQIELVDGRIAEIEQLAETDQAKRGFDRAVEVVAAANQLGYRPLIATSLELLGNLHAKLGHTDQAAATLEQAELAAEAAGDVPAAARICSALTSTVGADQHHGEAGHAWHRRALALLERLGPTDQALEATIQRDLQNLLGAEDKLDEARTAGQRALELDEHLFGPTDVRVAVALNDLAQILARQERLDDARALFNRALAIKERRYGAWHTEVAATVGALGELDSELGRYDDALREARRSLEIFEQAYGENHPDVAFELTSLADITRASGNYAAAQDYAERALAITETVDGPEHPRTADILSALATIAGDLAQYDKAERLYRRALAIREKALGPDHLDVASSLTELATILRRPRLALPLYERALAIEESSLGKTNPLLAVPLTGIGEAYLELHDSTHAASALERALALRAGQANKPFDFARIQFDLAQALWGRDRSRAHQLAVAAQGGFVAAGWEGHKEADRMAIWLGAHPL